MGSAPTNGNWLICLATHFNNNPVTNTVGGWTQIFNFNGSAEGTWAGWKKAGAGESTTQSPFTAGSENLGAIFEVSGLSGTWATDFQASHEGHDLTTNPSFTTGSFNTAQANTMVLGIAEATLGTGSTGTVPTVASGQTDDASATDNTGAHRHGGEQGFHKFFTGSGSAVQFTATWGVNQNAGAYVLISMNWTSLGQGLEGLGKCQVKGKLGPAELPLGLLARAKAQLVGSLAESGSNPLFALGKIMVKGLFGPMAGTLDLAGIGAVQVKGKTGPGGLVGVALAGLGKVQAAGKGAVQIPVVLVARATVQIKAGAEAGLVFGGLAIEGLGQIALRAKARMSPLKGYALTVRDVFWSIWPDKQ